MPRLVPVNPVTTVEDIQVLDVDLQRGRFKVWRTSLGTNIDDLAIEVRASGGLINQYEQAVILDKQAQHVLLSCLLVNLGLSRQHEASTVWEPERE